MKVCFIPYLGRVSKMVLCGRLGFCVKTTAGKLKLLISESSVTCINVSLAAPSHKSIFVLRVHLMIIHV